MSNPAAPGKLNSDYFNAIYMENFALLVFSVQAKVRTTRETRRGFA
jgi:hypothetical protein